MRLFDTIWKKTRTYGRSCSDAGELKSATPPETDGNCSCVISSVTDNVQRETRPRILPTPTHAQRLLTALVDSGFEGKELTVANLQQLYADLCGQLNWWPRPWNPLAKQFRLITSGPKKVYRWFDFTDGVRRRVRVFPIIRNPQFQATGSVAHTQPMELPEARRAVA
jgi:hypothetical protein